MTPDDAINQALAHHQRGELMKARKLYKSVLSQNPDHSDAHQFLGLLCFQNGDTLEAIREIKTAINLNPKVAPYHDNLGVVQEATGDFKAALQSYKTAASLDKEDPDRWFNMAIVFERLNQPKEAETAYLSAIRLRPDDSASHFNLGNLLKSQNKLNQSLRHLQRATECKTVAPGAYNNLGNALMQGGEIAGAVDAFEASLRFQPHEDNAMLNLSIAHLNLGNRDKARRILESFIARHPESSKAHAALGRLELAQGRHSAALLAFRTALDQDPSNGEARKGLSGLFRTLHVSNYDQRLVQDLLMLFDDPTIIHQRLARLAAQQLIQQLNLDGRQQDPADKEELSRLGDNKLFICLLIQTLNTNPVLEEYLRKLRKKLLIEFTAQTPNNGQISSLTAGLAIQCFYNEFLFKEDVEERDMLRKLETALSPETIEFRNLGLLEIGKLAAWAMYRPLADSVWAGKLEHGNNANWPALFQELVQRAVLEPRQERVLAEKIPVLVRIRDQVSKAVKDQYEKNPYPRWFNLPLRRQISYFRYLSHQFPHFAPPPEFLRQPVRVLSAGCGTGQETAMVARGRKVSEVVGLDLSDTSLAHAIRMSKKLNLSGVRFVQGDIMDSRQLGQKFAVIESTGVLHHMEDPLAGWRALYDCLLPKGVMKVGLYSRLASKAVLAARQIIEQRGITATAENIRRTREEILTKPTTDPLYALRYSDDFYNISACRDLLFHVQEQSYELTDLEKMLNELGMKFIGFEFAESKTGYQFRSMFPDDESMSSLENWVEYERKHPETFTAMYVFWCQKT